MKKSYKLLLLFAWYLGGQKEHRASGMAIAPGTFVSDGAALVFAMNIKLGREVRVMHGARLICAGLPPYLEGCGSIEIGENSTIREGAILQTYGGKISVGHSTTINAYCVIQGNGGVTIGDNVLIAAHVQMFSANHVFEDPDRPIRTQGETRKGIRIGNDVWIGAGAIIVDGVTIGDHAVVAAGAVVTRDVGEADVVAGVPARVLRSRRS